MNEDRKTFHPSVSLSDSRCKNVAIQIHLTRTFPLNAGAGFSAVIKQSSISLPQVDKPADVIVGYRRRSKISSRRKNLPHKEYNALARQ